MKRVLITGGTGFIGAWVIRHLAARCMIRVLDVSARRDIVDLVTSGRVQGIEWVVGDVCDTDTVRKTAEGCDALIHLAGVQTPACQKDPILGARVNVIGTLNVFEAAKVHGLSSVVYLSSAGIFGPDNADVPIPITHYGAFKLANEGSARAYWLNDNISSVGFRPYIVYGPGRDVGLTAGISLACRAVASGEPYVIPFTGEADFVFVEDLAKAIIGAALAPPQGARAFLVRGEVGTVSEIVSYMKSARSNARVSADGPLVTTIANIAGEDIRSVLPAVPRTSLADGIAATIRFFDKARSAVGNQS